MTLREDCRLLGHAWDEIPSDWTPTRGGNPMQFICGRCMTQRREIWGENTGELVSRRYSYTPGYQYEREDYRPSRDEMRMHRMAERMTKAFTRKR